MTSELNTSRLRLARERKGLNQIELSRMLGAASGLAGQWERGLKEPSLRNLKALAKALEVSAGWLLDEPAIDGDAVGGVRDRAAVVVAGDRYASRESVLSDYQAAVGLRDLASDAPLVQALRIGAMEWAALGSINFSDGLTKDGYCAALMILRTCSVEARRKDLGGKPGRHVATLYPPEREPGERVKPV